MIQIDNWQAIRENRAIVSFSFDDVLTIPKWDDEEGIWLSSLEPNRKVIDELRRLHKNGWKTHIVTSRKDNEDNRIEVDTFILSYNIPLSGPPIFTNGDDKVNYLKRLGSIRHYDIDFFEMEILPDNICGVLLTHPEDKSLHDSISAYLQRQSN